MDKINKKEKDLLSEVFDLINGSISDEGRIKKEEKDPLTEAFSLINSIIEEQEKCDKEEKTYSKVTLNSDDITAYAMMILFLLNKDDLILQDVKLSYYKENEPNHIITESFIDFVAKRLEPLNKLL